MEILKERYTITELSEYLKVTDHTLRYYEKEFCIPIPKDERGRRFYTTEFANIMYQIKTMRDEGLEIKAIRKILQSENIINDHNEQVIESNSSHIIPYPNNEAYINDIKAFFINFKDEITCSITTESASAKEHFSKELTKSKLELGACIENNLRKIESKMEKHFKQVDDSLSIWRKKNSSSTVKRFLYKVFQRKNA